MWPKHPASFVIDSATYLFTFSSPDIDIMYIYTYISVAQSQPTLVKLNKHTLKEHRMPPSYAQSHIHSPLLAQTGKRN